MNRLSVRLFLSHLLVAMTGGVTFYLLVRWLAPPMFEHDVGSMGMMGRGLGGGSLRQLFASAVNDALLVGLLVSVLAAAGAGAVAAYRTLGPLRDVRAATRRMAAGHYDEKVPRPSEVELAALADDVNALGAALADTEARRTRLLGEVAHEMRTPLTVINGYVEGLIDGVFRPDSELLGELGAEVQRLGRLADDLSELSRAEERRLELRLRDLNLGAVARDAAERLRPQFDDAGIRLVVDESGALPVRGDPDRLAQVVNNLLGNALSATPRGGSVRVTGGHQGRVATVSVTDTGVGLDEADLGKVFERFYRVPDGRRPGSARSGGSGIGLTIARGIAHAHGGDLTATSTGLGRGANFTLTVPLLPPGGAGDTGPAATAHDRPHGEVDRLRSG